MISDGINGCPEVKLMLIDAAVMDLEESLGDIDKAVQKAGASARRIKRLVNGLHMNAVDGINDIPGNRVAASLWEQSPPFGCRCGDEDVDIALPCKLEGHLTLDEALLAVVDLGTDHKKAGCVFKFCGIRHGIDKGRLFTEVYFRPDWYARILSACIFGRNTPIDSLQSGLFQNLKRLVTQRKELSVHQLYRDVYWLREGRFRSAKKGQTEGE